MTLLYLSNPKDGMTDEAKKYRREHRIRVGGHEGQTNRELRGTHQINLVGKGGIAFYDPIAAGDFAMQKLRKREEFEAQHGGVKTLMLHGVPVPTDLQMLPKAQIGKALREAGLLK